jgi:hypothetical protein
MSANGLERERVFPSESVINKLTKEKLENRYPLFDPISNLRYKHGKAYSAQLSTPIKLSSPKQLAILLYTVLDAPIVKKRKPAGTGKHEIEDIQRWAENTLESYIMVTSEIDNE